MSVFFVRVLPFAVAMSFTPGPNNLMLANAGARFGFMRTWPHQMGVMVGFVILMLCVSFGIAAIIVAVPPLYLAMKIASVLYTLFLAWKIATAEAAKAKGGDAQPMSFLAAAAFQWINPKAWIITLTAAAAFITLKDHLAAQVLLLALVFAVVGAASGATWAFFGQMIRQYLTSTTRRTAFNWTMAALVVVSLIPVLMER